MTGLGWIFNLIESGEKRSGTCVIAERFADVGEQIDISRCEDKAAAQLKGIRPKFVPPMASRAALRRCGLLRRGYFQPPPRAL